MSETVITYGTFDMFHIGHLRLIQRLFKFGETVIIGVSTDEFNLQKGKTSLIPYADRAEIVRSIKGVSLVIAEETWDQKRFDIEKFNVTTFVMGDDWAGKFDYLRDKCNVVYLPRTPAISTTMLKSGLGPVRPASAVSDEHTLLLLDALRKNMS
jgi:glycerol-3-phosphate cytidylyltransferase